MDGHLWPETALIAWVGSLVFAAFGVFMGYLLPSENVMQILGPGLALLAFLGGLFTPLDQMGSTFQTIAKFTPMYGLSQLTHAPLQGTAPDGPPSSTWSPGWRSSLEGQRGGSGATPPASEGPAALRVRRDHRL